jgi:hypothetical protein
MADNLKQEFVTGYVEYLKNQYNNRKLYRGESGDEIPINVEPDLGATIKSMNSIITDKKGKEELLKILKTINKLPRYECYDPAKNEFRPHCIPDVNESEIEYNTLNRESNDGAKYITSRAMKIDAQQITTDAEGKGESAGFRIHDTDDVKENFVKPEDQQLESLFKDSKYVVKDVKDVQAGGSSSDESPPSKKGPEVKSTEKTLYELVDEFGQNKVDNQENVEGQFSANIIRSRDDEGNEYRDEIITAMGNKEDIDEAALADWDQKRVQDPERLMLKGKKRWDQFRKPVANLLLITRKLRDFHKLSLAYVEKHKEVEYLVLTIRKLYYILIFIRDQIKGVEKGMDDLHILIEQILKSTKIHEDELVYGKRLKALKERQKALKQDRNALSRAYELASNSLLSRLNKIGATMHDVVDIESMPKDLRDELRDSAFTETEQLKDLENKYKKRLYNEDNSIVFELTIPNDLRREMEANPEVQQILEKSIDEILNKQLKIMNPSIEHLSNISGENERLDLDDDSNIREAYGLEADSVLDESEVDESNDTETNVGNTTSDVDESNALATSAAATDVAPPNTSSNVDTGATAASNDDALSASTGLPKNNNYMVGGYYKASPLDYIVNLGKGVDEFKNKIQQGGAIGEYTNTNYSRTDKPAIFTYYKNIYPNSVLDPETLSDKTFLNDENLFNKMGKDREDLDKFYKTVDITELKNTELNKTQIIEEITKKLENLKDEQLKDIIEKLNNTDKFNEVTIKTVINK